METLLYILLGIAILSVLVFIHEGGHYLASRAFGVRVTEFMLGLPGPNIGFKRGETKFGITPILLGGYARVCGMEPGPMSPHLEPVLAALYRRGTANMEDIAADCKITDDEAYEALEELVEWGSCSGPAKADEFNTYRAREVAGSYALGEPRPVDDAAALFNSEYRQQYRSLPFWKRAVILVAGPVTNLLLVFIIFVIIYGIIGLDYQNQETGEVFHVNFSPLECAVIGLNYLGMVVDAVVKLFNPVTVAETVSQSTSVVGIVALTDDMFRQSLQDGLFFVAAISASLGIMNLLPIPPLDGGKLVIEIVQKITRRSVSARAQSNISLVGIGLFLLLFVVLLNQDIQTFILG